MIEKKDFWTLYEDSLIGPDRVCVTIVDGTPLFYNDYREDGTLFDSMYSIEGTRGTFYESEEEAIRIHKERKEKVLKALHLLHYYYDNGSLEDVSAKGENEDLDWLFSLSVTEGYLSGYQHRERMRRLTHFITGTPMHADGRAFTYANIAYVNKCKASDKYFYKVVLKSDETVKVCDSKDMDILDGIFNLYDETKVFIDDNE